ncbi:MAG: hypothetical protein GY822_24815 [Deltaproteobacteria bacterium]|nr:hypothetical protein [Deltaproteobacteria bacterium]
MALLKQTVALLKQTVALLKQTVALLKQTVALLKQTLTLLKQTRCCLQVFLLFSPTAPLTTPRTSHVSLVAPSFAFATLVTTALATMKRQLPPLSTAPTEVTASKSSGTARLILNVQSFPILPKISKSSAFAGAQNYKTWCVSAKGNLP